MVQSFFFFSTSVLFFLFYRSQVLIYAASLSATEGAHHVISFMFLQFRRICVQRCSRLFFPLLTEENLRKDNSSAKSQGSTRGRREFKAAVLVLIDSKFQSNISHLGCFLQCLCIVLKEKHLSLNVLDNKREQEHRNFSYFRKSDVGFYPLNMQF